jgi:polyribonucleotide nucleotidyltransferase
MTEESIFDLGHTHVGGFLGKGWENVKRMQAESGATITVEDDKKHVKVTGDAEAVAKATVLVNECLDQELHLEYEPHLMAIIEGPRFATVKQIQHDSGVRRIETDRKTGKVKIQGTGLASVTKARELIDALVNVNNETCDIECQAYEISHVIGNGGETIKKLKADTGATIDCDTHAEHAGLVAQTPGGLIKIGGSKEAVAKARVLVMAILEEAEHPDYAGPEGSKLREEAATLNRYDNERTTI